MPSIGFAQITNDAQATLKQIEEYSDYFDKFYITIADKDKVEFFKFKKFADNYTKKPVKYKYFKWVNSFGKARLANHKMIGTDYWFWMDTDDTIDHPELIRPLVERMANDGMDMMFMNYSYYQNAHGENQADHWRERVMRTSCGANWADVPCHETVDAVGQRAERTQSISIIHHKTVADMEATVDRNFALLNEDWKKQKDPRTAYYLGMSYLTKGKYAKSVEMFLYLIEHGGWDEQKIVAWCAIADAYLFSKEYDKALVATNMAIHLDPSAPDPYYQKVIIYSSAQQYDKAVEWASIALTKQPKKDTMQLTDPTKYSYRGTFLAAQAYLFSGRIKEGFELFQKVKQMAPHFVVEVNNESKTDWDRIFTEAFYDEKAINYTKYLVRYFQDYIGNPQKLFESLPKRLFSDARLNAERVLVFPPKKWPEKSIAYYCGPGLAPWGPDLLENGVGGSEEAVIYLSRELAKLGWSVTVFCERDGEYSDPVKIKELPNDKHSPNRIEYVTYKPWTELNPFDEFDVFISSRQPANAVGAKARMKVLDLHDVNQPEQVKAVENSVNKIFVKSKWHRDIYKDISDDKFVIVGNAILKEHFNDDTNNSRT
jgi:tetratricopeptide (TPR) repeat protein